MSSCFHYGPNNLLWVECHLWREAFQPLPLVSAPQKAHSRLLLNHLKIWVEMWTVAKEGNRQKSNREPITQ